MVHNILGFGSKESFPKVPWPYGDILEDETRCDPGNQRTQRGNDRSIGRPQERRYSIAHPVISKDEAVTQEVVVGEGSIGRGDDEIR